LSVAGVVGSLTIEERGSNHLVAKWTAPTAPNGIINSYTVIYNVGEFQLIFFALERFESF